MFCHDGLEVKKTRFDDAEKSRRETGFLGTLVAPSKLVFLTPSTLSQRAYIHPPSLPQHPIPYSGAWNREECIILATRGTGGERMPELRASPKLLEISPSFLPGALVVRETTTPLDCTRAWGLENEAKERGQTVAFRLPGRHAKGRSASLNAKGRTASSFSSRRTALSYLLLSHICSFFATKHTETSVCSTRDTYVRSPHLVPVCGFLNARTSNRKTSCL